MLKIRLARHGAKNKPFYRVVLAEASSPRDGKFKENLGTFNPLLPKNNKERVKFNSERILYWISKGAKPTERISYLLHVDKNIDFISTKLQKYDDLRAKKEKELNSKKETKPVAAPKKSAPEKEAAKDPAADTKEAAPEKKKVEDKK